MHPILSENQNLAEVATELGNRLTRFNEDRAGPLQTRHIALTVRDDEGRIVAGLTGEIFWNALYVHLLWLTRNIAAKGTAPRSSNAQRDWLPKRPVPACT
jgi:hypothetical protein